MPVFLLLSAIRFLPTSLFMHVPALDLLLALYGHLNVINFHVTRIVREHSQ